MNGANADPCANTMTRLRRSKSTRIGASQNFLRTFRNCQNSASTLSLPMSLRGCESNSPEINSDTPLFLILGDLLNIGRGPNCYATRPNGSRRSEDLNSILPIRASILFRVFRVHSDCSQGSMVQQDAGSAYHAGYHHRDRIGHGNGHGSQWYREGI